MSLTLLHLASGFWFIFSLHNIISLSLVRLPNICVTESVCGCELLKCSSTAASLSCEYCPTCAELHAYPTRGVDVIPTTATRGVDVIFTAALDAPLLLMNNGKYYPHPEV